MNRCCWLELGWCFGSNVNLDGIPNLGEEEGGERASLRMQGERDEAGDVELLLLMLL